VFGVNMSELTKKNSGSKWNLMDKSFHIEELANKPYNEIYKHDNDPWFAIKKTSKKLQPNRIVIRNMVI
jgi:hypothetical protein